MFIENVGQFAPAARFRVQGAGSGALWLSDDGLWFTVVEQQDQPGPAASGGVFAASRSAPPLPSRGVPPGGVHLRVSFIGANPSAHMEPFG